MTETSELPTHTLCRTTQNNTEHYLWLFFFFKILSNILLRLKLKFHLIGFTACKYLAISCKHYT